MDPFESTTHSFFVRIWLEETAQEVGHATWRGHITHLPDGARRYIEDLDAILTFIRPYLQQAGVRLGVRWRLRRWLNRWRKREKLEP